MRGLEDLRIEDLRGLEDLRDPWRIEDLELDALPPHSRVPRWGRRINISIRINRNSEWLRLCRRPLLSTDVIRYCSLVTSERCLQGGRGRNGAPADFVFISY